MRIFRCSCHETHTELVDSAYDALVGTACSWCGEVVEEVSPSKPPLGPTGPAGPMGTVSVTGPTGAMAPPNPDGSEMSPSELAEANHRAARREYLERNRCSDYHESGGCWRNAGHDGACSYSWPLTDAQRAALAAREPSTAEKAIAAFDGGIIPTRDIPPPRELDEAMVIAQRLGLPSSCPLCGTAPGGLHRCTRLERVARRLEADPYLTVGGKYDALAIYSADPRLAALIVSRNVYGEVRGPWWEGPGALFTCRVPAAYNRVEEAVAGVEALARTWRERLERASTLSVLVDVQHEDYV